MSVNNMPNDMSNRNVTSNIMQQMYVIQQWANALVQRFPTAEMVDHGNNYLTIRIRFDESDLL